MAKTAQMLTLDTLMDTLARTAGGMPNGIGFDFSSQLFDTSQPQSAYDFVSSKADGATAVAVKIDTTTAWANTSAQLLGIYNNGSIAAKFDKNGKLFTDSVGSLTSSVLSLFGAPTDGATAVGVTLGSSVVLANASSKLLQIKNGSTEKAYFNKDGNLIFPTAGGTTIAWDSGGANSWKIIGIPGTSFSLGNNASSYLNLRFADGYTVSSFGAETPILNCVQPASGGFDIRQGAGCSGL